MLSGKGIYAAYAASEIYSESLRLHCALYAALFHGLAGCAHGILCIKIRTEALLLVHIF